MADAGIASRRKCEEIILEKRVRVNGKIISELGTKADPRRDKIEVDNKIIAKESKIVLILNKPRGVVSTVSDPEGRETVADLVKKYDERLFPVGRLDYNTSGALLMTNDGDLAYALTHPRYGAEKTYHIKLRGKISENVLEIWRKGVKLDDGSTTKPAAEVFRLEESAGYTWIQVTIKEGKNRQIRRMAEATGLRLSKLKRISFAGITIEKLPIGTSRLLTERELFKLTRDYINPSLRSGNFSAGTSKKHHAKG
jgi:pseudouridine synthase